MKQFHFHKILFLLLGFISVLILNSCRNEYEDSFVTLSAKEQDLLDNMPEPVELDLDSIQARKKLVALSRYNANSYFVYKGQPMGYEYELLSLFAKQLGVELEIKVPSTWDSLFIMLNEGKGDLIAANLTVTIPRSKLATFTDAHTTTKQVLVQKKPKNWQNMKVHQIEKQLIRNPLDLIGKKVYVRESSSYYHRLRNLSQEMGGKIDIQLVPENIETEQLIRWVDQDSISYTIADENIAKINQAYLPNIDVQTAISFPQRIAWATRKNAPKLLQALNTWIQKMKHSDNADYYVIYNKYYKNTRAFKKRQKSKFFTLNNVQLSPWDSVFKKEATQNNLDWILLASQAYQESRFDPQTKSWAGALGLMQLLPTTASAYGITNLNDPVQNIHAGASYMRSLMDKWWKALPDSEAIKFTLASYNAGPGHVLDAQRLAKKYGKDPNIWDDNVAEYILKKSEEKFYYDPVVRNGYCRGSEPYNYVKDILRRYKIYKDLLNKMK